jgi:hypothetical protein
MKTYPVWPLTKYSLPQARLDAIAAEVMETMRADKDTLISEMRSGARCSCCDEPLAGPGDGLPRECQTCREYV